MREKQVRLLAESGENLGVVPTEEALTKARKAELDLVLIAPQSNPPVARIMDFTKFLYMERKKKSQNKVKAKKSELKEFRIGPTIGQGDLDTRVERAIEFIKNGDRVKVTVQMQGREKKYPEVAMDKLKLMEKGLEEVAKQDGEPKTTPGWISTVFVHK
ncbi:translation initiation factor IF-3 [candidate division WWE3 bacterium RIFOXYB2_FULL_41_6]|nr:MAG: translation initiation factor IF-3 [candidate division WWE3 bacterium RIFOXYB2_FULL_41_6]